MNKQYLQRLKNHVRHDFFFVNIGANDGISDDPIYPFIKKYGWKGIAVEPVPDTFKLLKQNLSAFEGIIFENVAIGQDGREILSFSREHLEAHPLLSQMSSFSRDHLEKFTDMVDRNEIMHQAAHTTKPKPTGESLRKGLYSQRVDGISFNALMEKHHVKEVNFINVDTEDDDFDILMSIDMDKYAPKILCVETHTFDKEKKKKFDELMQKYNYTFLHRFTIVSEIYIKDL